MKTFATSDTHFGHANIIRYANRPFRDWREMGEAMIARWNRTVAPEDKVFFVGDFAMGPGATEDYVYSVLSRLHGTVYMILGNHDQPTKYGPGLKAMLEKNRSMGRFEVLVAEYVETIIDGKNFVLCHYPMEDWNGKFKGAIHLHGHTHTQCIHGDDNPFSKQMRNRYDIGVDMYGGPVRITGDLRYLNDPHGWA